MYTCMCKNMYMCIRICIYHVCKYISVCVYACTYAYKCVHVHMHISVCVCVCVCVCVYKVKVVDPGINGNEVLLHVELTLRDLGV